MPPRARATEAYHDFGQSVSVFDLLGEGYQSGLSYLELGRLAAAAGRAFACDPLSDRSGATSSRRSAPSPIWRTRGPRSIEMPAVTTGRIRRRPDGRRRCAGETDRRCGGNSGPARPRRGHRAAGSVRRTGRRCCSCSAEADRFNCSERPAAMPRVRERWRAASQRGAAGLPQLTVEPIGRAPEGPRIAVLSSSRTLAGPTLQRFRTLCAVLRQGFDLCHARDRQPEAGDRSHRTSARAAAPRVRLRQRRDAARRRADPADAEQRS